MSFGISLKLSQVLKRKGCYLGANEVDLVFPYKQFIRGHTKLASTMIKACKKACGEHVLLKVIIESGELKQQALIESACQIAISADADIIRTFAGKVMKDC